MGKRKFSHGAHPCRMSKKCFACCVFTDLFSYICIKTQLNISNEHIYCIVISCIDRFFLYVFLAAVAVLLLLGAQQLLGSFGVSCVLFEPELK